VVHPTLSAVRGLTPIIAKHAKNRNAKSWQGERLPHLQPPRLCHYLAMACRRTM
jgi:hypothetical protein